MTPIEVVTKAVRGSAIAGLTAGQKKNLKPFVELIAQAAKLANEVIADIYHLHLICVLNCPMLFYRASPYLHSYNLSSRRSSTTSISPRLMVRMRIPG